MQGHQLRAFESDPDSTVELVLLLGLAIAANVAVFASTTYITMYAFKLVGVGV